MSRWLSIAALLLASACGSSSDGPTPVQACNDLAAVVCAKYFECTTAEEREVAMIPATEDECVAAHRDMFSCAEQTAASACPQGGSYDPARAAECVQQYQGLSCDTVRDGPDQEDTPACGCQ